jgi:chaperonin GroEL
LLFVSGAVIGAALGGLFAPRSGGETREQLADWLKERRSEGADLLHTVREESLAKKEAVVAAAKAAVEEGIVPGGGSALVIAAAALVELRDSFTGDKAVGVEVVRKGLEAPLYWIASNAGLDGAVVVAKVSEGKEGFNAATLTYGDLLADGVVDPVKVTRSAVVNAASVARMILTTESAIVEKPADADDDHGHHGHAH